MKIDRLAIVWTSPGGDPYAEPSRVIATIPLQVIEYWRNITDAALTTIRKVSNRLEDVTSTYSLIVNPYQRGSKVQGAIWAGCTVEINTDEVKFTRNVEGVASYLVVTHGILDTLHNLEFDTLYERGNNYGYSYIRLGTTLFLVEGVQWDLSDLIQFEEFLCTFYNDAAFIPEATIGMENAEATSEEIETLLETYARQASKNTLTSNNTGASTEYQFLREILHDMLLK